MMLFTGVIIVVHEFRIVNITMIISWVKHTLIYIRVLHNSMS